MLLVGSHIQYYDFDEPTSADIQDRCEPFELMEGGMEPDYETLFAETASNAIQMTRTPADSQVEKVRHPKVYRCGVCGEPKKGHTCKRKASWDESEKRVMRR